MDRACRTCGVVTIEEQMKYCRLCYDHSNWVMPKGILPLPSNEGVEKEEKKMHDVKVMEAKEVIPEAPRVSYLGQTALNTLADIYTKLGMIEDFIDAPTETYPSLGNVGCPDNLIHNLKQINEIANVINQRLDRLQEKL